MSTLELVAPFIVSKRLKDNLGLECKTLVVYAKEAPLVRFAEELLIAAAGVGNRWFDDKERNTLLAHIRWAIQHGTLYGPKEVDVSSVRRLEDLPALGDYRVRVIEHRDRDSGELKYIARLEPMAYMSVKGTSLGTLKTMWREGKPVLRVLFSKDWYGLHETVKWVSRELPIGVSEVVVMTTSETPGIKPNSVTATLLRINGVLALGVSAKNPRQVMPETMWKEAVSVMGNRYMMLPVPKQTDRAGRITTVYPRDRLLTTLRGVRNRGANEVIRKMFGFQGTPLLYGATDFGGNWVELLQLYVACLRSGLPGVFDIDHRAHSLGSYFQRILGPSLALIGHTASLPQSLVRVSDREIKADQLMRLMGVPIPERVAHYSSRLLPDFYLQLHREFVRYMNELLGASVDVRVVRATEIYAHVAPLIKVKTAINVITQVLSDDRVFMNIPNGDTHRQVRVSELSKKEHSLTVEQLLARNNAWPGGTLTYLLMGGLAHFGPIIFNLKDSRLGLVSLASTVDIPGLPGRNQSRSAVSSVVRCYPKYATREGGDNVDPLVLFEMLQRYPERTNALLKAMVERWAFPLKPENAGEFLVCRARYNGGWDITREVETSRGTLPGRS